MNAEMSGEVPRVSMTVTLQWGRVRMNAEIGQWFRRDALHDRASMEPRSDEHGNAAQAGPFTAIAKMLQWGRVRMNAEIWSNRDV